MDSFWIKDLKIAEGNDKDKLLNAVKWTVMAKEKKINEVKNKKKKSFLSLWQGGWFGA